MTVLESPTVRPVTNARSGSPVAATPPRPWGSGAGATALIALLAVVGGWVAFELFEGPVARTWYETRQRQQSAAFAATRSHVGAGAAIGVLQVPRLGIDVVVAEGTSPEQLRGGPGHRVGTPLPGDVGNSVVVGHAKAWGGPLARATSVRVRDLVVVQTHDPRTGGLRNAVFRVLSVRHAAADDLTPFAGSTDHRLTIVSGGGGQFSDRRLVIVAVSGTVGRVVPSPIGARASFAGGSRLWNAQMLLAAIGIGCGLLVIFVLRRRYRAPVVAITSVPLLALGLVGLLLNIDLLLPALR